MTRKHCEGILLYYKYVDLTSHQEVLKAWYLNLCKELDLKGRVRVAKDGINCTVSIQSSATVVHSLSSAYTLASSI